MDSSFRPTTPAPQRKRGRPSGQFAYNRERLFEFLKNQPKQSCELSDEQIAEEVGPLAANATGTVTSRQVRRWLSDLVRKERLRVITVRYRYANIWKCIRKIQVIETKEET